MNHAGRSTSKNGNSRRAEQPDPFRFGWRYVQQIAADGSKEWVQVPLTLDDMLHPQEGDEIPDNSQQGRDCNYLYSVLKWRLADNPRAVVFTDCLVNWGARGLGNHSPDISVFDGVADPNRIWRTFAVAREGARPVFVIEIVSPDAHDRRARDNDVVIKVREYYRARVPIYALVDQEQVEGPRRIVGYRRGSRKYVPIPLDEQGRLLLESVRLLLGLRDERAVCWDADTGEEIPDFAQLAQTHQQTEAALLAEAQARQQAEANRQQAEAGRLAEMQARQASETALADALARIRELEARARNGGPQRQE